jgi:AraC-like DNA-binding protein
MSEPVPSPRRRLIALLRDQATREGFSSTPLPGVQYLLATRHYPRAPVLYEPSIVILATGRKRAYLGDMVHVLDPGNSWVVSVPLPFDCETEASPEAPLLGLSVRVDTALLGELLLDMDEEDRPLAPAAPGMYATPLTTAMTEAAARLVAAQASPMDSRILGPGIVREIVYRTLGGSQGATLRALAARNGHLRPISRALRRIHSEYQTNLDVEALAREAFMSVSTFHHAFRAVTATSPLRYIKTVRLHKARRYLSEAGATAGEAASQVGYASPSQFSREYKRLFGLSPSQDATRLRGA